MNTIEDHVSAVREVLTKCGIHLFIINRPRVFSRLAEEQNADGCTGAFHKNRAVYVLVDDGFNGPALLNLWQQAGHAFTATEERKQGVNWRTEAESADPSFHDAEIVDRAMTATMALMERYGCAEEHIYRVGSFDGILEEFGKDSTLSMRERQPDDIAKAIYDEIQPLLASW